MIISESYNQQDTIPRKIVITGDSARENASSVSIARQAGDSVRHRISSVRQAIPYDNSDTTSVCTRNSIADITFWDLNNFILQPGHGTIRQFPYVLIEEGRQKQAEEKAFLIKHLKSGIERPSQPLHSDWIILVIIIAALLFALVKKSLGKLFGSFEKFFSFRAGNEWGSKDLGGLFYWQSTILNLVSFLVLALFGYCAASYYNFLPSGFNGVLSWVTILLIISAAVTLRHLTCVVTGAISGRQEVFREYLLGVYQSYRFGALFLFAIVILMSYTRILPVNNLIISGLIIVGIIYLLRVFRLLAIFLNRNISIFYLILYLCALEILPVLIVAKFITGLV